MLHICYMKQKFFDYKAFAKAVKKYRSQLKISLRHASGQSGVGFATLSRVENQSFKSEINTILALCDWMATPLDTFIKTKK